MKHTTWLFTFLISIAILMTGCNVDGINCITPDDDRVTEVMDLPGFTGVKLAMEGEVFITQGPKQLVEITGSQNIIDRLDLDIRDNTLVIDIDRCIIGDDDLRVEITIPKIEELLLSGSGKIESVNTLEVGDIYLSISGSGNMDLVMEAKKIDSRISGSGNIQLTGIADEVNYTITGSGNIEGFDVEAKKATTEIRGAGNIEVTVVEALDVNIRRKWKCILPRDSRSHKY